MSMFSKFFGREKSPEKKTRDAFVAYKADVVSAAERKLGRVLSEDERRGIDSIGSLMMLESCWQSFASEKTSLAQVEKDLGYFTAQAKAK